MLFSEDKCTQCGKCCYRKVMWQGIAVFTNSHCPHYNVETKLCKDYENRLNLGVGCLTVEEAIKNKALPNDCPYVEDLDDYVGPVTFEEAMSLVQVQLPVNR